jgi:hypothetical protein
MKLSAGIVIPGGGLGVVIIIYVSIDEGVLIVGVAIPGGLWVSPGVHGHDVFFEFINC